MSYKMLTGISSGLVKNKEIMIDFVIYIYIMHFVEHVYIYMYVCLQPLHYNYANGNMKVTNLLTV